MNATLIALLVLAAHLTSQGEGRFELHVLQAGAYGGMYRVERGADNHFAFRPVPVEGVDLPAFDAERTRRMAHLYSVFITGSGESLSVNLGRLLSALPSVTTDFDRSIGEGDIAVDVHRRGDLFFLSSPAGGLTVIAAD